jgi:CelD/BcsL family acetyltransferase involved in cellulose biosynthesis
VAGGQELNVCEYLDGRAGGDARVGDSGDVRLVVVTDPDELAGLRDEWNAAAAADPAPNVYVTWEWVHTWWTHFGLGASANDLHVIVVRDREGLVAIAPFQRSRVGVGRVATRVLQRISPEAGDYGGIVLVRRQAEAVALIIDHLEQAVRDRWVDVVVISRFRADDAFLWALRSELPRRSGSLAVHETNLGDACLLTDVRDGFDLAAPAKRHRIPQRLQRLADERGPVTFTYHSGDDLDEGFSRLLHVHARRWADRSSEVRGLLADPVREAFLLDAVRALDRQGWVRLLTLTAAGRLVAAELDFAFRRQLFMFKGAFDPDHGAYGPGQLLFHRMIEDELRAGLDLVDWGRGDQPYKRRWANGQRRQLTVTMTTPRLAGRLRAHQLRATRALERRLGAAPG